MATPRGASVSEVAGMADVSVGLFWVGAALTALATVCLAVASVGRRVVRRQAMTNAGTITLTDSQPASALWGRLASWLSYGAGAALVLMLVARTIATGHPPYTNMFEYLSAFGAGILVADAAFSSEVKPLMPALQNNRLLGIHVASMLISYSILGVAFVGAALYLVQDGGARLSWLPSGRALDDLTYKAVVAGFPILGLGIALGAYWGNIAWGRYWGWDPKETTALVTWLVFAGYLHARSLAKWRGSRAAWLVVIGFGVIVFNIFAVNFWISGLHSYA